MAALLAAAGAAATHAAGGHHAIDDAALLEPGQCQLEAWHEHSRGGARIQHLGPACRIGGVEAGLNIDRWHGDGTRGTDLGLQAKWAMAMNDTCSLGSLAASTWAQRPHEARRHTLTTVVLPLSCTQGAWAAHANVARDLHRGAPDAWRHGIAVERGFGDALTLTGEAWRDGSSRRWRAALRWQRDALSIDLGRQQRFGARDDAAWALGVNLVLGPR